MNRPATNHDAAISSLREVPYAPLRETMYAGCLTCGMPIYVLPKPGFVKSYAVVVVRYGSMDMRFWEDGVVWDTPAGVAHFLEHKMFDLPGGENALQRFASFGASPNAYTSHNRTGYHFSCVDHFMEHLDTLLELVTTPLFTPESVEKEQGIIAQEIRMIEDSPDFRVYDGLLSGLFPEHPLKTPIAGTVDSIAQITSETLRRCFSSFYHPSRMILAVSGDLDPEAVFRRAEHFLKARPVADIRPDHGSAGPGPVAQHEVESRMEVGLPLFALGFKCAPPSPGQDTEKFALLSDLAMDVFCGRSSDLYERLFNEGLINRSFDVGEFHVEGGALLLAMGESSHPEVVRDRLLEEAFRIGREGISDKLFARAARAHLGAFIRRFDSPEALCRMATTAHDNESTPFAFFDLLQSFTSDMAARMIAENVIAEQSCLSVIRPLEYGKTV